MLNGVIAFLVATLSLLATFSRLDPHADCTLNEKAKVVG